MDSVFLLQENAVELKRKSFRRMYSRDTLTTEDEDEGKVLTCSFISSLTMVFGHTADIWPFHQ